MNVVALDSTLLYAFFLFGFADVYIIYILYIYIILLPFNLNSNF